MQIKQELNPVFSQSCLFHSEPARAAIAVTSLLASCLVCVLHVRDDSCPHVVPPRYSQSDLWLDPAIELLCRAMPSRSLLAIWFDSVTALARLRYLLK